MRNPLLQTVEQIANGVSYSHKNCMTAIAQRDQLLAALKKAQEDINFMINSRTFLNGHVFRYIDEAIQNVGGK